MSDINLVQLLNEVSSDSPCGENLEEDAVFLKLENEAKFVEERQIGDSIIPAKEPDWKTVKSLSLELLERTRDIQIAMHLTCALVRTDGFYGLEQGLILLNGWLKKYWDSVYPLQDSEDNYPLQRVNTLSSLNEYTLIREPINNIPLIKSDIGNFSWRNIEITQGKLSPAKDEVPVKISEIDAFFNDDKNKEKQKSLVLSLQTLVLSLKQSLDLIQSITETVTDNAGANNVPDLSALSNLLQGIVKFVNEKLQQFVLIDAGDQEKVTIEDDRESFAKTVKAKEEIRGVGIHNRNDVVRSIDEICKYFDRYEPSSPVPFLLLRAKKLLTMDFMEILRDMTPDAVKQAENICGVQNNNEN